MASIQQNDNLGIQAQGSDPRNNSLDKKIKPMEPPRQNNMDVLGQKRQSAVVQNPSDMNINMSADPAKKHVHRGRRFRSREQSEENKVGVDSQGGSQPRGNDSNQGSLNRDNNS